MAVIDATPGTNSGPRPASPSLGDAEVENLVKIFRRIRPPSQGVRIGAIEVWGDTVFLNGSVGGDHIVYVEFERRYDLDRRMQVAAREGRQDVVRELAENRHRLGILLADVSGHSATDALVAAMLHQAFLTGVLYELDRFGGVTTTLFENLNTRFFNSVSVEKYVTMIYGEISDTGTFRFIIAGHPRPLVFSAEYDTFASIASDRLTAFYPLGMFPSADDVDISRTPAALRTKPTYTVNEVNLMAPGDILLLFTDGLTELGSDDGGAYVPERLEQVLRRVKHRPAGEIWAAVRDDAIAFAPPEDDLSVVVIKRAR